MKIGILREGKVPADKRVPLTPQQCKTLLKIYPKLKIEVQSSPIRCFSDEEYRAKGIDVKDDISSCAVFIGVKEVPVDELLPGKSYLFFSHTIKKQDYNKTLLQTVLDRNIRLMDYEVLTAPNGARILGFGRYAGIVGAYNAFLTFGQKHQLYELKPAYLCDGKLELMRELKKVKLPNIKLAVTGNGRVANGVLEILEEIAIRRLSVDEYLNHSYDEACYVQLTPEHYNVHKEGLSFDLMHFFKHPEEYKGNFKRFCKHTDLLISAAFWDPKAPVLFTTEDMQLDTFKIQVIADITCDIGGSIPSTIRATEITEPHYDFNPKTSKEEVAFSDERNVTVMSVDNLPCELPKDASREFGSHLVKRVLDFIIKTDREGIIERATIAQNGKLKDNFKYLEEWVNE